MLTPIREGKCKPSVHLTEGERTEYYYDVLRLHEDDWDEDGPPCPCCHLRPLTELQLEALNECLMDHIADSLYEEPSWYNDHEAKCDDWKARTGHPCNSNRGFFTKHSKLFFRHFGLNTWVTHRQLQDKKDPYGMLDNVASTINCDLLDVSIEVFGARIQAHILGAWCGEWRTIPAD